MAGKKDSTEMPTPVASKTPEKKRLKMIVVGGVLLLGAVLGVKVVSGGGGSSASPATGSHAAVATVGAGAVAGATPVPVATHPGPQPNTTRDPFKSPR